MHCNKLILGMVIASLTSLGWASPSQQSDTKKGKDQAINQQIEQMSSKIDHLKKQVDDLKQQTQNGNHATKAEDQPKQDAHNQHHNKPEKIFSSVSLGEFTGVPNYYDGHQLVVNAPSILEDYKLLKRNQKQMAYYRQHGLQSYIDKPRLILSGALKGLAKYRRDYRNDNDSDINLSSATLDAYMEAGSWVSGLLDVSFDNADSQMTHNRINNANIYLDRGFITIGNLNKTALFGSIGQLDVPFGRYSSSMISDPLTAFIGKIKTRAITLGYRRAERNHPYGNIFVYHGASDHKSNIDDAGADAGYLFKFKGVKADIGSSVVNNIADAKGFQGTGLSGPHFQGFDQNESLEHVVPASDVYARISVSGITLLGEYVTALRHFDQQNLSFNGDGAKPSAWHTEATYGFDIGKRPSSLSLAYDGSDQALGINIPRQRYSAALKIALLPRTLLTMEYRHDVNYDSSTTAKGQGQQAYDSEKLGHDADAITARIALYF